MASTCKGVLASRRQGGPRGPRADPGAAEPGRAHPRSPVFRRARPRRGRGRVQARAERAAAVPRPGQAAPQGQRGQRPGFLGVPRRAVRRLRLLPDRVGDRPGDHQRPAAAGVPGRPDRRRVRAHAGQLRDLAGRPGHRQPLRRAGGVPGELDRQHGRARADPGVLHRGRGVGVGQPVPDEPRGRLGPPTWWCCRRTCSGWSPSS